MITIAAVHFLETLVTMTKRTALGAALVVAAWIAPATAAAEPTVGADLDYTLPIDQSRVSSGFGLQARVGQYLEGPTLAFTPELGFGYASFSGDLGPKVYRGFGGARVAIGDILRPGLFGHAGIARLNVSPPAGVSNFSRTAFTYDVGAFLDLSVIPHCIVGAHFAYERVHESSRFDHFSWGAFGAHAAVVF